MMVKPKLVVAAPASLDGVHAINWDVCCICQTKGSNALTCPAHNPIESRRNLGYKSLAQNLEELKIYRFELESGFKVECLDEGKGIEQTFIERKAKWHRPCALKYLSPKFDGLKGNLEVSRALAEPDENGNDSETLPEKRETRSSSNFVNLKDELCFLCDMPGTWKYPLRRCSTDDVYEHVAQCAHTLGNTKLIAMLADGDLAAQEGKYHLLCLSRLYNQAKRQTRESDVDQSFVMCEGIAFADILLYIQGKYLDSENYVIRMGDIVRMYRTRLAQLLGVSTEEIVTEKTNRFREKILAHFPDLKAEKSGREYVLMRTNANILTVLDKEDQDEDALAFHHFAKRLRRVVSAAKVSFNGTFKRECEESCIPAPLLAAVNTLLYGSAVRVDCRATKPALTICQLLIFNFHERMPKGEIVRNKKDKEPPLPLYIGLSCYGHGRDKSRIDEMHKMGISVSSNRVMELTSHLCRLEVERSKEKQVVCPSQLKHGLFTVSALDNIDHKTSSSTSTGEFHGTGISMFQLPCGNETPVDQVHNVRFADVANIGNRSVPDLPDFYVEIPDCILKSKQTPPRNCSDAVAQEIHPKGLKEIFWKNETLWFHHVQPHLLEPPGNESSLNLSWGAFHAEKEQQIFPAAVSVLLPLFHEKSTSPSMIRHGMSIVKNVTKHLNGSQTPVICVDQPLYAICKAIQWQWPGDFGENKFVVFLGPLHIEQAFLRTLGQFLKGSGWIQIFASSGIISAGSAEAILKVTHITKARAIHQVAAAVLHSLLYEAYETENPDENVSIEEWIADKCKTCATFKYWLLLLNLVVLLLSFVRSVRQGNFLLFKETLGEMLPWFFLFDHHNYARWLAIFLQDLQELGTTAPDVFAQFLEGNFVVRKSGKPFSGIGIDHAHEQNNASVKGKGGAVGLTEDPSSLRRWTIGGPELSRLLHEYKHEEEDATLPHSVHHEQYPSFQKKFINRCVAVRHAFLECENPFLLESDELIALDTRLVVEKKGVDNLYSLEERGTALCKGFFSDRLISQRKSIYDPISKEQIKIFDASKKKLEKNSAKLKSLSADCQLFSRLFIISTARDFDLNDFFRHENQLFPPSLSLNGEIRSGDKAHLVKILESLVQSCDGPPSRCEGIVFDGAALTHLLKLSPPVKNIKQYCELQLKPYLCNLAGRMGAKRVDVAWDLYSKDSIKGITRDRRGVGVRQQNLPAKGVRPTNWEEYLKNSQNKEELFKFLAETLLQSMPDFHFVTNVDEAIVSTCPAATNLHNVSCSHMEEADVRILVHVKDMVECGASSVLVRCSDTDVLVLGISYFHSLKCLGLKELWFLFGVSPHLRYIPVHTIAEHLGESRSVALRGFHAFTGCDSVSFFASKGKKTAWSAWKEDDEKVTLAFKTLAEPWTSHQQINGDVIRALEKFTVSMYDPRSESESVNETRQALFCSGDKALITTIPPTAAALEQHIRRATYQAGIIWGQVDEHCIPPPLPSPELWGWTSSADGWIPFWTELPSVTSACRELDRCGCGTDCETQRCICRRYNLPCTPACKKCKGQCSNKSLRTLAPE